MASHTLTVDAVFQDFVENELLPDLDIDSDRFWKDLERLIDSLTPRNRELLQIRDQLQQQIDAYHVERREQPWNAAEYRQFLCDIGYLETPAKPFKIDTADVDAEIATVAGPQLVVPVSNARFALNAANARWGSLYDALYGTDVIPSDEGRDVGDAYNPIRGDAVIAYAAEFLDRVVPLTTGSHQQAAAYNLVVVDTNATLEIQLSDGTTTELADIDQFVGHTIAGDKRAILLCNNGLHIDIRIDPSHPIGKSAAAGIADIILESAVTTIQDCEDSVAAVDAADKVGIYRNWLGLMRGSLAAAFTKGGKRMTRALEQDREYTGVDGTPLMLSGRSLMLVRNVGHLMTNDAIVDANGEEVFEGILDAVITTACALYDLRHQSSVRNSRAGSVYIVKPKMHGSAEAAFADALFAAVEDLFGLERNTLKIGVMDEERRTSVNLEECIRRVRHRLVFINTGFLDRTGDEIHTSMLAGPMLPKEQIKTEAWINAYEDRNVDVGIRCGLPGHAQIGKGMWPKPDEMLQMVETKQAHVEAGANCAWVPSPTAATLHAMHYHHVDVAERQRVLADREMASLNDILTPPFGDPASLTADGIQQELDNNTQGILGYVVRWIDLGIGCSKVPDINDVGLMEDRATLRISSQHTANWLHHDVCTEEQVMTTFKRMAQVVDEQNSTDPHYTNMAPDFEISIAFQAACALVFEGREQPNGYTEPLLHDFRKKRKG